MTQPFDDNAWELRQIAELQAEIERWKVQHEEFLLKHERENTVMLESLQTALAEISSAKSRITELEDFVSACRYAGEEGLEKLKEEATKLLAKRKATQ